MNQAIINLQQLLNFIKLTLFSTQHYLNNNLSVKDSDFCSQISMPEVCKKWYYRRHFWTGLCKLFHVVSLFFILFIFDKCFFGKF